MEQIAIRFIEKPDLNDAEGIIRWFCNVFGLSNPEAENPVEEQILKTFVAAARDGKGLSSSELDLESKLARSTVIYHLNRFRDAGLLVKRGRKYYLRAGEMEKVIQEIGYDLERELRGLIDTARRLDAMMHGNMISIKSRGRGGRRGDDDMADEEKAEEEVGESEKEADDAKPDGKAEMREKMLRLAAEFDNYKKRIRKEVEEAGIAGKASLVKEILPVVDEFQLAILALEKAGDKDMLKGITMLYSNFMDTLKRNGLSEISCEGRFNPFRHEIVMVRESREKEGTILDVVKKGYEFNGRMIRPASVVVAKPEGEKEDNR